jgi:hypothetical protein
MFEIVVGIKSLDSAHHKTLLKVPNAQVVVGLQSGEVNGRIYCTSRYILHCTWWVLIYTFDWFIFGFVKERNGRYLVTYRNDIDLGEL